MSNLGSGALEFNFDGLVGPTHNYAGLSRGNLASDRHRGAVSNPRAAALQGLKKMRRVWQLGVGQALLPPQPRPDVVTLRRCGFYGQDHEVIRAAAQKAPALLGALSSASAMWTANAATVAPSSDTLDGLVHLVPANLVQMFHRSVEVTTTQRVLSAIFHDERHFAVHAPLPPHLNLGDEGAANHSRLWTNQQAVQLFGFGRGGSSKLGPTRHPARQTLEASESVARLLCLKPDIPLAWQQHPEGIDQGAFHSDVLAVANASFLMLHELAFYDHEALLSELRRKLGTALSVVVAKEQELPVSAAVAAYPFNSQLLSKADGSMLLLAPAEAEENPQVRTFLERVVAEQNPVNQLEYIDVRQSMSNGGGPACLRLRVVLSEAERNSIKPQVFINEALLAQLESWVQRHYRDRLSLDDLSDPALLDESRTALDELTELLKLGSIYDFQDQNRGLRGLVI